VRAASEAPGAKAGQRPALGSVTLEVTPQIAGEGAIMLSVSPIVTVQEADTDDASAVTVIRESDTLARIADGETLVLGGFTRERETRERRNAGVRGGWFGRSTVVTRKRLELVILLTPKILVEF
jgi:type II secretory pathway component GspD/PulD (secretin)